jgi:hypothetical protein
MIDGTLQCLITGTGRSGTLYISRVLTALGVSATHENESSVYVASYYHAPKFDLFDWVVHETREPLKTIGSLTTFDDWSFTVAEKVLKPLYGVIFPRPLGRSKELREGVYSDSEKAEMLKNRKVSAIYHAYYYNKFIEDYTKPLFRFKVEEFVDYVDEILALTGVTVTSGVRDAAFENISKATHHRSDRVDITWDEIESISPRVFPMLKEMAERYGYD